MGFRLRERIRILPGLSLNLSKSGISTSIGRRGASLNIGNKGTRVTAGLPGSGLSYSTKLTARTEPSATAQRDRSSAGRAFLIIVLIALVVIVVLAATKR